MADVAKILAEKGGDVIRIDGEATVFDAIKAMVEANVGAILVTGADATASRGSSPSATTCGASQSRAAPRATRSSAR